MNRNEQNDIALSISKRNSDEENEDKDEDENIEEPNNKNNQINILGDQFVEKNINNCVIIYRDKEYKLCSFFQYNETDKKNKFL